MKTLKASRFFVFAMVFFIVASSLTGCKLNGNIKGENDIKISIWRSGLGIDFFNQAVADFKRDTGYNVITEDTSDASVMKDSIELGLRYNNVDLYMFGSVTPSYHKYLEPLNDVLNSNAYGESVTIESKYNTEVLDALKASDGNYYHLSYGGGWAGITYNADIVDGINYKVPNTTEELDVLVQRLSSNNITPFIHFESGGYWFVLNNIWQAQYDGLDYYNNTFLPLNDGTTSPSKNVLKAEDGRKKVIEFFKKIISPAYIVNGSNGFKFTEAQTRYLDGQAAMMANGTWLLNEMKNSKGRYSNFLMMKTPVISEIIDKCPDKSISDDEELSALITAIDAAGSDKAVIPLSGSSYSVTQSDLDRVYEARNIMFSNLDDHAFSIPIYASAKEGAKEFIRYFYSAGAMKKYIETLHMKLPLTIDTDINTSTWNGWEKQQMEYNDVLTPIFANNPNKSPVFTLGGARAYANVNFITSYSSQSGAMTSEEVWSRMMKVFDDKWESYLSDAQLA